MDIAPYSRLPGVNGLNLWQVLLASVVMEMFSASMIIFWRTLKCISLGWVPGPHWTDSKKTR